MQSLLWLEIPDLFTSNFGVAAYTERTDIIVASALRMDRKNKSPFCAATPAARLRRRPPLARGTCAPPARRRSPPERPVARRSAAQRDFDWCWIGASGWGRVAP